MPFLFRSRTCHEWQASRDRQVVTGRSFQEFIEKKYAKGEDSNEKGA
ncbi:hypothetical protein QNI16_18130 [Cytophagaceae bacterium YF14B1]|uniref:Uncharacterized protein n=1 Tax=Xanthocytophaga flava TaxID=3048013 RepID=A0AAE3U712_9BACT|nr:hypothetical protein [Xanthocytophaga flavus]MDJ1482429.1 hypothetical protein [Xanthocytophaga flavus]